MKNIGYRFLYCIMIPLGWACGMKFRDEKSFEEFKSGLKKHEHEFEEEPYEIQDCKYDMTHYHACKHKGCNLVKPKRYLTEKGRKLHSWDGEDVREYEIKYGYEITPEPYFPNAKRTIL